MGILLGYFVEARILLPAQPTTMIYSRVSENIRRLRVHHNLSGQELSRVLGWDLTKFYEVESGRKYRRITLNDLRTLAEYFHVSVEDICDKVAVITFEEPKEEEE